MRMQIFCEPQNRNAVLGRTSPYLQHKATLDLYFIGDRFPEKVLEVVKERELAIAFAEPFKQIGYLNYHE